MNSPRITACLLPIVLSLFLAAGCQSSTPDTTSGNVATPGVAVNPAMSARQRALIARHHQDN